MLDFFYEDTSYKTFGRSIVCHSLFGMFEDLLAVAGAVGSGRNEGRSATNLRPRKLRHSGLGGPIRPVHAGPRPGGRSG